MKKEAHPPYLKHVSLNPRSNPPLDRYPFSLPAVRGLDIDISAPVTIFVGENGSGKSTLIEAIAVAAGFNAEGGTKNFNFSTRRSESVLHEYLLLNRGTQRERDGFFLRAESLYNVGTEIERLDRVVPGLVDMYGGKSLHDQSHGESFLSLVKNRFGARGLFILDEPEAALSPQGQITLLVILHKLVTHQFSQVIMATHSPILMAFPGATIYQITDDGVQKIAYDDTEHYQVTRTFLNSPHEFLDRVLKSDLA